MSKEAIVARILSDADAEAEGIVGAAETKMNEAIAAAEARAAKEFEETEAEAAELSRRIFEGRAAAARLDAAKVLLAEKRRVIDEVYARALKNLLALSEHDSLELMSRLLETYAEEGDEVVFSCDFAYPEQAARLPVVKKMGLKVSKQRMGTGGGCVLKGKNCDKDLTYSALLAEDREEHQSEIAASIFRDGKKG